jgi:hypothetical protein
MVCTSVRGAKRVAKVGHTLYLYPHKKIEPLYPLEMSTRGSGQGSGTPSSGWRCPNGHFPMARTSRWSPDMAWRWHRHSETGPLWKNRTVHRHHYGGDLPHLHPSLEKKSGGTGHLVAVTRRCTATPEAVYTGVSGDHPEPAALGPSLPSLGGHRPRGGGITQAPNPFPKLQTFSCFVPRQLRATLRKRC